MSTNDGSAEEWEPELLNLSPLSSLMTGNVYLRKSSLGYMLQKVCDGLTLAWSYVW